MGAPQTAAGPDFSLGIAADEIAEGATIAGRVGDDPVLLSHRDGKLFAIGASCTHYGGPLGEGFISGDHVRCPWHHACFSLRTGEALEAPAFDPVGTWRVDVEDGRVFVRERIESAPSPAAAPSGGPRRIVIVGGGAAGFAAAEMLRRKGFSGDLTMLSADEAPPCDRPNLSKDYLAGNAPEEWIPLKPESFYSDNSINLRLGAEVVSIDPALGAAQLASGETIAFDALLLATGASPVRLKGFEHPNVYLLRTLADSRAIIAATARARRVAIVGASFIGLETAASLRARGLEVHVAAPDSTPLEKALGKEIGAFVKALHEAQGVVFHLGRGAQAFDGARLQLDDGGAIEADFVVLGVGVRPNVALAARAGLAVEGGVTVNEEMRTSAPNVFAAGDIAAYPDPRTGERVRVEHWVAAEHQGQTAALNMLGERTPFRSTPFFWSNHYDRNIRYVGHATRWDEIRIDGSIDAGDFTARYFRDGRLLAAASLGRDHENAELHAQMDAEAAAASA